MARSSAGLGAIPGTNLRDQLTLGLRPKFSKLNTLAGFESVRVHSVRVTLCLTYE